MRVPWSARRSNQSILKEINPEYSLEGLMLKLHYSGYLIRADSLEKTVMAERLRPGGEQVTEDEKARWHHLLNAHKSEQTVEESEGQGSLVCCSSWGCRVRHDLATEQRRLTQFSFKSFFYAVF